MASIQGIYVALFGRPADPAGLAYFNGVTNNGANLSAIANLAGTQEYQARFTGMTNEQVVNSIYQSLFGRAGETAGVQFWVQQLQSGRFNINNIAVAILDGAKGADLDLVNAKIAAANLFTTHLDLPAEVTAYAGTSAAQIGRDYITSITTNNVGTSANADAAIAKLGAQGGQTPAEGGGVSTGGGGGGDASTNSAPAFGTKNAEITLAENGSVKDAIHTAHANDVDGNKLTYSLKEGDSSIFLVNKDTGEVSLLKPLDYEATEGHSYQIKIQATDGLLSDVQTLTIKVGDVNEAPAFAQPSVDTDPVAESTEVGTVVYNAAATDPDSNPLTYSLVGEKSEFFSVEADGSVKLIKALDFENSGTDHSYVIKVQATDGSLSSTQDITINVGNVNEAPVFATATATTDPVAEDTAVGTAVYTASATDPEKDGVSYSLEGADKGLFKIDKTSGEITVNGALDYENSGTGHSYSVTVVASDKNLSSTQDVTIKVGNVNEAPVFAQGTVATDPVAEDTAVGTAVYKAAATDPDSNPITYSLVGEKSEFFSVEADGSVKLIKALDFENSGTDHSYVIKVQATDGSLSSTQDITINVGNVNEAPVFATATATTDPVAEDTAVGTAVYTASATDPEKDGVSYSLEGADKGLFKIDKTSGEITVNGALDYENSGTGHSYSVTVVASDKNLSSTQDVTIKVGNVNEAPVFAQGTVATDPVAEDTAVGTAVYKAAATDPDSNPLTYSLVGEKSEFFSVEADGSVKLIKALDFENSGTDHSYVIKVQATDGSLSSTQDITINVGNVNEAPVFATATATTDPVAEDTAVGTAVYTASATDPEKDGVSYSLEGADKGLFKIDKTSGEITVNGALDYENSGTGHSYSVTVVASDKNLSSTQDVTIKVGNVNEAPVFAQGTVATDPVAENTAVGTAVYKAAATDPDSNPLTYSLVGEKSEFFSVEADGSVKLIKALDFESSGTDHSYVIKVQATDGSLSSTQDITINVGNVNEAPVFATATATTAPVAENAPIGTAVYTASATDPEKDGVSYSLEGADKGLFKIDKTSGEITVNGALDYENSGTGHSYSVTVVASDKNLSSTQDVTIKVGNVNEAPVFAQGTVATDPVAENTAVGTAVYKAAATDPDSNPLTYSLVGEKSEFFSVEADGSVKLIKALDFESSGTNHSYTIKVKATDGSLSSTQDITINVGNVNEAPVFATATATTAPVAENAPIGTAVYTASATDPEKDGVSYSLEGADKGLFKIDKTSGEITVNGALDYENSGTGHSYSVTVVASDKNLSSTQDVTIKVGNVNEAPVFAQGTVATDPVAEDTAVGTAVYKAAATDPDSNPITYSLIGQKSEFFSVESDGSVKLIKALDFESSGTNHSYTIKVKATDGSLSSTQDIIINVGDVNEAPVFTSKNADVSFAENNTGPISGYKAVAGDPEGKGVTFSLSDAPSQFVINPETGVISVKAPLDYENSGDSHSYTLTVVASDTVRTSTQLIKVNVTDVVENQTVDGGDGADIIDKSGSLDNWTINGKANNDTIKTGVGSNKVDGGSGVDSILLMANGGVDKVVLATQGPSLDTVSNFEVSRDAFIIGGNTSSSVNALQEHGEQLLSHRGQISFVSIVTDNKSVVEFNVDPNDTADLSNGKSVELFDAAAYDGTADRIYLSGSGWKGFLVGYDYSSALNQPANTAYIYAANDADKNGYLTTDEVQLVAVVNNIGTGDLKVSNFVFA